jgi:hypothetical protein
MRFLVDLYRGLILLILAIALIAGFYLGFMLSVGPLASTPMWSIYIACFAAGAVIVILCLGITATFISIHDRIAEMAVQSKRIADALDRAGPSSF